MKKLFTIFIMIFIVFLISGCQSVLKTDDVSDIEAVNELYGLKDTYIGDSSTVRAIIDLSNNTQYTVENIELKTDAVPFRITINFIVDSRANYRYIDENGLNRMSGLVFALVENADEILYQFYDRFSDKDNSDGAFFTCYYTRNNLCERISSDKITVDYIENSADTVKTFEEYYTTIMATEVAEPDRAFLDKVYELIGDDCEITGNSSIGAEIELDKYSGSDFAVINEYLAHDIGKYRGAGIKAQLMLCDIRNYVTREVSQCVFLYYTHPDEGVIMIESGFVDRNRYDKILKLIMRAQTQ